MFSLMVSRERLVRYPVLLAVSVSENPNQNNIARHSSDLCKSLPFHSVAIAFPMKPFPSRLHRCEMFSSFRCTWSCMLRCILQWTLFVPYDKCRGIDDRWHYSKIGFPMNWVLRIWVLASSMSWYAISVQWPCIGLNQRIIVFHISLFVLLLVWFYIYKWHRQ